MSASCPRCGYEESAWMEGVTFTCPNCGYHGVMSSRPSIFTRIKNFFSGLF